MLKENLGFFPGETFCLLPFGPQKVFDNKFQKIYIRNQLR